MLIGVALRKSGRSFYVMMVVGGAVLAPAVVWLGAGNDIMTAIRSWEAKHREPYGRPLAERVAERLEAGEYLANNHIYYCGHGLFHFSGRYVWSEVNDGCAASTPLVEFDTREAFVAFLAAQSDFTAAGFDPTISALAAKSDWDLNNQRISRERLEAFVNAATPE